MIRLHNDGFDWICTLCGHVTHRTRTDPMKVDHNEGCPEIKIHTYEMTIKFQTSRKYTNKDAEEIITGLYDEDFPGRIVKTKIKAIK